MSRLARFVLFFTGQNAGWNIYPVSGMTHFQALVMGDSPKVITPNGTRPLP